MKMKGDDIMKKIIAVVLSVILLISLASTLNVFGAELSEGWTVLENSGEESRNGSLTVTDDGQFLLTAIGWDGYGVGSKKMYKLDSENPIDLGLDVTTGVVCPTGEGSEVHRYFAVVLTNEAMTCVKKHGASTLPSLADYIELRIYDTNAFDGTKMARLNVAGVFTAYSEAENTEVVSIDGFNSNNEVDETLSIKVNGNDIEFWFNGALLITAEGCADAFNGKVFLNFMASAYGSAGIENTAVKTINGVAANESEATLEKDAENEVTLNGDIWEMCLPPESVGQLYLLNDNRFVLSSAGFGGIGVMTKKAIKVRNIDMTLDVRVPVGNIPTGGPDYLRGFSVVFSVNPVNSMVNGSASAMINDDGWLAIRITDDEAMDGTKNLYIIPSGSIANASFGDIEGPVNEPIKIEGINAKENANIELNVIASGKNLTVKVNGTEVATVEGIMKGFYGRASVGFTASSYGSAICQGIQINSINGADPNNFDFSLIQVEVKENGGCGNNG